MDTRSAQRDAAAPSARTLDSFPCALPGPPPRADNDPRPGALPGSHRRDRLRLLLDQLGRRDSPLEQRDDPREWRDCLRGRHDPCPADVTVSLTCSLMVASLAQRDAAASSARAPDSFLCAPPGGAASDGRRHAPPGYARPSPQRPPAAPTRPPVRPMQPPGTCPADATVRSNDATTCSNGATPCQCAADSDVTVSSTGIRMDTRSAQRDSAVQPARALDALLRPPPRHSPTSLQTVPGARCATGTLMTPARPSEMRQRQRPARSTPPSAHRRGPGPPPREDDDTHTGTMPGRHKRDHLWLSLDRPLGRRDRPPERRCDLPARRNCPCGRRDRQLDLLSHGHLLGQRDSAAPSDRAPAVPASATASSLPDVSADRPRARGATTRSTPSRTTGVANPGRTSTRAPGLGPVVTVATACGSYLTACSADATVRSNDATTCPNSATACAAAVTSCGQRNRQLERRDGPRDWRDCLRGRHDPCSADVTASSTGILTDARSAQRDAAAPSARAPDVFPRAPPGPLPRTDDDPRPGARRRLASQHYASEERGTTTVASYATPLIGASPPSSSRPLMTAVVCRGGGLRVMPLGAGRRRVRSDSRRSAPPGPPPWAGSVFAPGPRQVFTTHAAGWQPWPCLYPTRWTAPCRPRSYERVRPASGRRVPAAGRPPCGSTLRRLAAAN